jgi:hypothetical protein
MTLDAQRTEKKNNDATYTNIYQLKKKKEEEEKESEYP